MQRKFKLNRWALLVAPMMVLSQLSAISFAQAKTTHPKQKPVAGSSLIDGIVAVVNTDVITQRQLQEQMNTDRITNGDNRKKEQVLQGLIDQRLMQEAAEESGITISSERMGEVISTIAKRNNMTPEQLREAAKQHNLNWDAFVDNVHNQVLMDDLRQSILDQRMDITEGDIDAYLKQNPTGVAPNYKPNVVQGEAPPPERRVVVERSFEPKAIALKHIYIRIPDGANENVVEEARKKANLALRRIRDGSSFEAVAREFSDGAEASKGGDIGMRLFKDWPELFVSVTKNVPDGRTSGIFKAANGFHILKVVERRGLVKEQQREVMVQPPRPAAVTVVDPRVTVARSEGEYPVVESHIRHILVKISPVVSDAKAHNLILEIQQKIQNGLSFEEAAEKYSQDTSAPLGGDLGWLAAGAADPNFQKGADALAEGQMSPPVRSVFGWHLIEVMGRRTTDKKDDVRRELAREGLYTERANAVLDDWLLQLRSRAYIDNRLTGQKAN